MDWLGKMNAALDYIEDHLAGEIDYAVAARKACCSSYNFQRMFSFIAEVTLGEYIRRRRLTLAALELTRGDATVLETAIKYGYDSPVSFARAFVSLHGITPKEAKVEGARLKNYPRISFQISIKGVEEMEYRMESMEGFRLVGVKKSITTKEGQSFIMIPKFWNEICEDGTCVKLYNLANAGEKEEYGVCCEFGEKEFNYMIAVKTDQDVPEGMEELQIPAGLWVKFECRGRLPESQQKVWKRIYSEWFPTSGYEETGGPELEWYSDENMGSDNYLSEIWLPVRKCNG